MAEEPASKSKRRVRNPDTFRERAEKAAEISEKPSKIGQARRKTLQPLKPAGRAIRRSLLAKAIGKVLGWIAKAFNFITRSYFKKSFKELKLVTWPGWKQGRDLTGAVIIFAIIFGASIALVDFGLDKLFRNILLK